MPTPVGMCVPSLHARRCSISTLALHGRWYDLIPPMSCNHSFLPSSADADACSMGSTIFPDPRIPVCDPAVRQAKPAGILLARALARPPTRMSNDDQDHSGSKLAAGHLRQPGRSLRERLQVDPALAGLDYSAAHRPANRVHRDFLSNRLLSTPSLYCAFSAAAPCRPPPSTERSSIRPTSWLVRMRTAPEIIAHHPDMPWLDHAPVWLVRSNGARTPQLAPSCESRAPNNPFDLLCTCNGRWHHRADDVNACAARSGSSAAARSAPFGTRPYRAARLWVAGSA